MKTKVEYTNYDDIAEIYIPHSERMLSWNNLYERPNMLSMFENFDEKNVVDIGCGTGFYTNYALNQGANVTAVDASQKMLDHVDRKYRNNNLSICKADLHHGLPFIESNSQDYIICSLVLHYIEKWDYLLNDFSRILQKNGKIYISVQHPFADHLHLNKKSYYESYLVEDTWGNSKNPFKVHYYTRSLEQMLSPIRKANLILDSLSEPLPNEACKEKAPETYKRIKKLPPFLFMILTKSN
jgi:ubiquinone/menaquinone biosynthesis C-methylase UbiE